MLINHFRRYMEDIEGIKENTVKKYIGAIGTINGILERESVPIINLFNIQNCTDAQKVKSYLDNNDLFLEKDSRGHKMYSVALKHYIKFAHWYF